ncbi:hypothetical protein AMJ50_02760 [Parcubacteria bacterium DG_74_3]|nr:MAG: hypothetical protein AMJ50_02760 [Parcubacteria bacterium DG_74_3]
MEKKKIILLSATFFLILVLIGFVIWKFFYRSNYYAVYLSTGDIYFGKLVCCSRYILEDSYYLRVSQDQGAPISVERFQDAFWAPRGKLKLNSESVVWIVRLAPTSPVVEYIEARAQGKIVPQQQIPSTPQDLEGEIE